MLKAIYKGRIAAAGYQEEHIEASVKGNGEINLSIAQYALEALNIDRYGLDEIDNKILCTIIDKVGGGPVGLGTIATAIGENSGTLEEVYEPFLIKEGFLKRTPEAAKSQSSPTSTSARASTRTYVACSTKRLIESNSTPCLPPLRRRVFFLGYSHN